MGTSPETKRFENRVNSFGCFYCVKRFCLSTFFGGRSSNAVEFSYDFNEELFNKKLG